MARTHSLTSVSLHLSKTEWDKSLWNLVGDFLATAANPKSKFDDAERGVLHWVNDSRNWHLRLSDSMTLGNRRRYCWSPGSNPQKTRSTEARDQAIQHSWKTLQLGYSLCILESGYIGWVTPNSRPGDQVAILHGCSMPLILRRIAGSSAFRIVGEGIIYGFMKGEAMSDWWADSEILLG